MVRPAAICRPNSDRHLHLQAILSASIENTEKEMLEHPNHINNLLNKLIGIYKECGDFGVALEFDGNERNRRLFIEKNPGNASSSRYSIEAKLDSLFAAAPYHLNNMERKYPNMPIAKWAGNNAAKAAAVR
jgi:hypothetical protein